MTDPNPPGPTPSPRSAAPRDPFEAPARAAVTDPVAFGGGSQDFALAMEE